MKCPKCGSEMIKRPTFPEPFRWYCLSCGHEEKVNPLKDWDEAPYLVGTVIIESTKNIPPKKRKEKVKT